MKKIAIFLPKYYRGGVLRASKNFAKALAYQTNLKNMQYKVVFSCLKNKYDIDNDFNDLIEFGINIRETTWDLIHKNKLDKLNLLHANKDNYEKYSEMYTFPNDGANCFLDCDLWIIITDRLTYPLMPIKEYICINYDYIQRYSPEIFSIDNENWEKLNYNLFQTVRNAKLVLTTTPSTLKDLITFAGVEKEKAKLINMDFDPPNFYFNENDIFMSKFLSIKDDYLIWPTNANINKNHERILLALIQYYEKYKGKLKILVTGYNTNLFDPNNCSELNNLSHLEPKYIMKIRSIIAKNVYLRNNIVFKGYISDYEYFYYLKNSKFLLHSCLYDNGTFCVIEAAYFGIPSLSSKYPAMEYINKLFSLNMKFYNPFNIEDIAINIKEMENNYDKIKLPDRNFLEQFSWKNNSRNLFDLIISNL